MQMKRRARVAKAGPKLRLTEAELADRERFTPVGAAVGSRYGEHQTAILDSER
jgi:hypothetical protein